MKKNILGLMESVGTVNKETLMVKKFFKFGLAAGTYFKNQKK